MEQTPKNLLETLFQHIQVGELVKIIGMIGFQIGIVHYLKPSLFLLDPLVWVSICVGYMFLNYSIATFYSALTIQVLLLEARFYSVMSVGFFFFLAGTPFLATFLLQEMQLGQRTTPVIVGSTIFHVVLYFLVVYLSRPKKKKLNQNLKVGHDLKLNFDNLEIPKSTAQDQPHKSQDK